MTQQQNIDTTKRFGEAVNAGDFQAFHELMAPGIVDRDPAPD